MSLAICFAVMRHRRRYEFVRRGWMDRGLRGRDAEVQALLLCGLLWFAFGSGHVASPSSANPPRMALRVSRSDCPAAMPAAYSAS